MVVTVDPGKRHAGIAIFSDGALVACTTVRVTLPAALAGAVVRYVGPVNAKWVAETPQNYRGKDAVSEDLDALRAFLRHLRSVIRPAKLATVRPGAWKGNVPKTIHHARIARVLTPEEARLLPDRNEHDTWDAVALGLWSLGRTVRGGTTQERP